MTIEAKDGIFEGDVKVFVHDKEELDDLVDELLKLPGIERVDMYDTKQTSKNKLFIIVISHWGQYVMIEFEFYMANYFTIQY